MLEIMMVTRKSLYERTKHHHWHWIAEGVMLAVILMLAGLV